MDGFRAFRGKYSVSGNYTVNGVYIIVNNLPFYLRTLIENMILAIVVPGPKEPTGYAMDQIMEPLVDDLIELSRGVQLPVFNQQTGQIEMRTVYATLSMLLLDWMARIKCTGHVGLTSEMNHCLYCTMRQCHLSLERGYRVDGYQMRDPFGHLQFKHEWLRQPEPDREAVRQVHGTRFIEFDRIPSFYSFDNCPIDGMHLFDHGITAALVRDIIYSPGMLRKLFRQQPVEDQPESRFDAFVQRTYFPSHCGRLPPKIENMGARMKAEQWRTLLVILPAALFAAWCDPETDTIPGVNIPRGAQNSLHYKVQQSNASLLLQKRRNAHYEDGGDPDEEPTLEDCASSRNPREYFLNILRYCVAYRLLFKHRITREEVEQGQALLERFGATFARMNVHLTPSFHCATHIAEHILKFGNVFGTWMYDFERANRVLININTNGHGLGTLEATMAKGFLRRAECYCLVQRMQDIPNPSEDDIATIEILLAAMRFGPEHESQRGMLNAVLAGEAHFQGQETIRLATVSAQVDFESRDHEPYYQLMINFCSDQLPGIVFYGHGRQPAPDAIWLGPKNTTRSYSHFFRYGIRYGSSLHHRGKRSRYGYIGEHIPVVIRRIYEVKLDVDGEEHEFLGVVVQRFVRAQRRPIFPWHHWEFRLGIDAWAYDELGPLEVVRAEDFTGVFALSDIEMSYGHYWLTFAMVHTEPEDLVDD
ncbi:Transposase family tnp2 [Ceratobasidium sp. AG-Ba]|nr:Transposase family tnp2 [Ceratobasidium sp. AG-Ba]QRW11922.1 Transposase family tnp2 [Ceratobasidium sp. AG-Ba]